MAAGEKVRATKVNASPYLGIVPRMQYYFFCSECTETLSFTTDPENADYKLNDGATRSYQSRDDDDAVGDGRKNFSRDDEALRALGLEPRDGIFNDILPIRAKNEYIVRLQHTHEMLVERLGAHKMKEKAGPFNPAA